MRLCEASTTTIHLGATAVRPSPATTTTAAPSENMSAYRIRLQRSAFSALRPQPPRSHSVLLDRQCGLVLHILHLLAPLPARSLQGPPSAALLQPLEAWLLRRGSDGHTVHSEASRLLRCPRLDWNGHMTCCAPAPRRGLDDASQLQGWGSTFFFSSEISTLSKERST